MKRETEAAFSVESCLVFPVILFIILMLLQQILELHDRTMFQAECYRAAVNVRGSEDEQDLLPEDAAERLLISTITSVRYEKTAHKITIFATLETKDFVHFPGMGGTSVTEYEVAAVPSNAATKTRIVTAVREMVP